MFTSVCCAACVRFIKQVRCALWGLQLSFSPGALFPSYLNSSDAERPAMFS